MFLFALAKQRKFVLKVGKEIQTKEVASSFEVTSGSSADDAPGGSTGTAATAGGEAGLLRLFLIMGLLN